MTSQIPGVENLDLFFFATDKLCHDRAACMVCWTIPCRICPRVLGRVRILVAFALACLPCTQPPVGACPFRRPVATQGLPALATTCRDTGSKGLCRYRENLCRDPSHLVPAPAPNPVATPKFCRNTGPSNFYRDREFSVVIEEIWAVCRDRDFLLRQSFCFVMLACTRSLSRTCSCRARWCALVRHSVATRGTRL